MSNCQGNIDWYKLANQKNYKLKFAVIRSTMGDNRTDDKFVRNITQAKKEGLIVGSYHYYDPNENSSLQAENYLKNSRQDDCDIIPVLDIERFSNIQPTKRLLIGVKNWLNTVEKKTGHKPMIYTKLSFYKDNFANKKEFKDYPRWIAAYSDNRVDDPHVVNAHIHQFSEKLWIKGIKKSDRIDGNVILDSTDFQKILKQ